MRVIPTTLPMLPVMCVFVKKEHDFPFILYQSMKVKLQPPSGAELAPFNPILSPASITQIMLLANPTKASDIQTLSVISHSFFCHQ